MTRLAFDLFYLGLIVPAAGAVALMLAELGKALGYRPPLPAYEPLGPWYPPTLPPVMDIYAEDRYAMPRRVTEPMPAAVVAEFDKLRAMIDAWGIEGPA